MAKRDEYDDFWGDDEENPVVDTRADGRLYRVPTARLSPNLVNPRDDFGTKADLVDFGKSLKRRQLQACPVVSRAAYLKLWPDHAEQIGDVDYVIVSGERRFRAAVEVGLAALDCIVNDDVAADRQTFLEAVVSENVDRQNFDPVEEAHAVAALVEAFGTNRAVAEHFERADGWVTQRINLTYLHPGMKDLVRRKGIPLEEARKLGQLVKKGTVTTPEEQDKWWADREEERRRQADDRRRTATERGAVVEASEPSTGFTAVKPKAQPVVAPQPEPLPADVPKAVAVPATPSTGSPSNWAQPGHVERALVPEAPAVAEKDRAATADASSTEATAAIALAATTVPHQSASDSAGPSTPIPATRTSEALEDWELDDSMGSEAAVTRWRGMSAEQRSGLLHSYFQAATNVEEVAEDLARGLPPAHSAALAAILQKVSALLAERS